MQPSVTLAIRRGKRRKLNEFIEHQFLAERAEKMKASIRDKVEHPFHVAKNLFRHRKARDKGMAKNTGQLLNPFGLANVVIVRRSLLEVRGRSHERLESEEDLAAHTLSLPMRDTDFLCGSISALSDRLHRSQEEVLDDPIHRVGIGDRPHMP
jgi:hypothetical protein